MRIVLAVALMACVSGCGAKPGDKIILQSAVFLWNDQADIDEYHKLKEQDAQNKDPGIDLKNDPTGMDSYRARYAVSTKFASERKHYLPQFATVELLGRSNGRACVRVIDDTRKPTIPGMEFVIADQAHAGDRGWIEDPPF